jgi:hypothetical protein
MIMALIAFLFVLLPSLIALSRSIYTFCWAAYARSAMNDFRDGWATMAAKCFLK